MQKCPSKGMGRNLLVACCSVLAICSVGLAVDENRAGPDWWSLQKLTHPKPPTPGDSEWGRNPIDAFVLTRLEANNLAPSPPADRATLIRRTTFDLHGLPPTPEEIDAFVKDASPNAFERVIVRLLASPRYGERWARHWLDVVRFSESQGFERDIIRDHAWRYRDYVIESFNSDKPYDRFVREQIAGDVLEPFAQTGVIATGFLVAGAYDEAGNGSKSELLRARIREEELEDMIGTVGQTILGLTVNCARCHDHKFDPIPQRDYYRLKAVFDSVRHGNRQILSPDELKSHGDNLAVMNRRIEQLESQVAAIERSTRELILQAKKAKSTHSEELPRPLVKWSFESDTRDEVGELHGSLKGGATVANGRLQLDGKGAFVETSALPRDVSEKTLEVWAMPANLTQRGGGLISIEKIGGGVFDAIVFGEREPKKWLAGSSFFHRTKALGAEPESTLPGELVHIAIIYRKDHSIAVYRNGVPYGETYVPRGTDATLRTYSASESHVLLGLRHTGAGNGFFAGEIEEARVYDRALTPEQVATSFRSGVPVVTLDEVVAALSSEQREQRAALIVELEKQRGALKSVAPVPQAYAANTRQPEPTHVLLRGDVEKKAEQVSAGGLSCIPVPFSESDSSVDAPEADRRRRFADWVSSPANPFTARVMVNRIWHYRFGRGIVATPNDFGWSGDRPSHPDLLDWLAAEFMAGGWSVKELHKRIMMSKTYQQSSDFNPAAAAIDADQRLLWRFPPRRLEGEAVRDAMLAVSGQLNLQKGGPSFRPFELKIFNSHFYNLNDPIGPDFNRRTVYRINVNSAKDPLLESMDCPDPSTKTPKRSVTTTPIQALGLMNNSFVQRQARNFAERVKSQSGAGVSEQIELAYRIALGRNPTQPEIDRAAKLVREDGLAAVCWVLLNSSEFMYLK